MNYIRRRNRIVNTALRACELGLGKKTMTSGNISIRVEDDSFLITPSGVTPEDLLFSQIVNVFEDGSYRGDFKPSSEWRFHRDIYGAYPHVKAIVHTHAPFATTIACMERGIPAFHYMIAAAGGNDIRCADYATFGTQELSDNVVKVLDGRGACLLSHHGMIATGPSLDGALKLAVEVENLAETYWRLLQVGAPEILDDAEMEKMQNLFKTYGQQQKS